MIYRILKSAFAAAVACTPLLIATQPTQKRLPLIVAYFGCWAFWNFYFVFENSRERLRAARLDALFRTICEGSDGNIRVHIFRRQGVPRLVERLKMVYTFPVDTAAPDYGITFWTYFGFKQGLCWQVASKNQAVFADSKSMEEYRLSRAQRDKTEHVQAIFAFPLHSGASDNVDSACIGIISFDAIDRDGERVLKQFSPKTGENLPPELTDLVNRVSLEY